MDPAIAALPMARYRMASKSLNDRPIFLMWAVQAAVSAEAVFITCLEQFQDAPSKAKSQVMYEWLLDQDTQKAKRYSWGAVGLQADGVQDNEDSIANLDRMRNEAQYFMARKTWIGKLRNQIDGSLGNTPRRDMYDFVMEVAIRNAQSSSMGSNSFSSFKLETLNLKSIDGMVERLKGMELLERDFRKAGFNTAKMGFRLPFRFR